MRFFEFRTIFLLLIIVFLNTCEIEAKVIHKAKLVKVVRREITPEKTRLSDGTKFERFIEKGDLPPLPIEEEEEADDLNDPRIGHLDQSGGIAVPVGLDGKVLKGYEYLLKPITIDLDLEEDDSPRRQPIEDNFQMGSSQNDNEVKDYKPYPNNQDMAPKSEFLPEEQGDEYDDVASEPKESLPEVPDLPKAKDYTDSGETDNDLKAEDGDENGKDGDDDEPNRPVVINEVIIPSSNILPISPVSEDDVSEASKSADEIQKETETISDGDSDKNVDIPKNRLVTDTDIDESKLQNGQEIENESLNEVIDEARDENEIDLSEADVEDLAKDFGKSVLENVMSKASEFGGSDVESESEDSDDGLDPNAISAQAEIPSQPETVEEVVAKSEDSDGVILPDQSLSDEELAKIAAESLKPAEPAAPEVVPPRQPVRGGRIGSGVQPDSTTQNSILLQFLIVSFVMFFL